MTHRERILATLTGGRPDRPAWFPDLTYWYQVNRQAGSLRDELAGQDLLTIHRKLDAGLPIHFYNHGPGGLESPRYGPLVQVEYHNVEQHVRWIGKVRVSETVTPHGTLVERRRRTSPHESPFIIEHRVKGVEDFPAVEYLYSHRTVRLNAQSVANLAADLGQWVFWDLVLPRSPLPALLIDLMGLEAGTYALHDDRRACERLFAVIEQANAELIELLATCGGTVCIFGDNIDNVIISPSLFRRYLLGYYQRWSEFLHGRGKLCACHMDGRLRGLLPMVGETGLDILDGLTPAPMNDFELDELAAALPNSMRLWCGVPASLFCGSGRLDDVIDFARRIVETFGPRVVLNVGDQLPPDGDIEMVRAIGNWLQTVRF